MSPPKRPVDPEPGDLVENALGRLREAQSILQTIQDRDLLAELPADPAHHEQHQAAVSLLAVLGRELDGIANEMQAAIQVQEILSPRALRTNRPSPGG